jgi:Protein of unknown function (DUF3667)
VKWRRVKPREAAKSLASALALCYHLSMSIEFAGAADVATGALVARAVEPDTGETSPATIATCLNCKSDVSGRFCGQCGQKAQIHRTLHAFGHDIIHGVLHFDGKIWRTLPMLIFNPGHLTRRYVHGERARFVSPMALFLFTVFLSFAVFSRLAPKDMGVNQPVTAAQSAKELADEKAEILADIAELQKDRKEAEVSGDATGWIDGQLERQRSLLTEVEKTKTSDARVSTIAQRKFALEQRNHELSIARLEAKLAAAKKSGQPTTDLEDELRAEKLTARLFSQVTGRSGVTNPANETNGVGTNINFFGIKSMNDAAKHAMENPQLLLYKVQSNAYKYSWALIPISIPFVWLLFFWRRDYKMFDHAVFVTYSLCFMLTLFATAALLLQWKGAEVFGGLMMTLIPPIHIHRQIRQAYQTSFWGALWRTAVTTQFALLAIGLFVALILALGVTG